MNKFQISTKSVRLFCPFWAHISIIISTSLLVAGVSSVYPQSRNALSLNAISELLKSGVSSNRIVQLVEGHGISFEADERVLQRLRDDGGNEPVLAAVRKMSARYTEERKKLKQLEELAKRRHEEEAKRRELEKIRAEEERRQQAEAARKEREEAERLAQQQAMQRQQAEARRKEEEARIAEQQRQQAEAEEKERRLREQRRLEEVKLAEEKRRIDRQALMLDALKNGHTSAPTYNNGDTWHFNVIESFPASTSRDLRGIYEVRYRGKRFYAFQEQQPITAYDGYIGILFAMFSRTGGQYLNFPLSIGQKWNHQYKAEVRASRIVLSWNSEATVTGIENITTPAGKFWALKIVREESNQRGGSATCTYYYSPQTKSIVRMLWEWSDSSRLVELVKYRVGE
jgi:hypothetical protein